MADPSFGSRVTSHMLRQRFVDGAWGEPEIVPFGNVSISPLAKSLHYGQSVFEGMKAYRGPAGQVALFRPVDHLRRLQQSARRLCMPEVDVEVVVHAIGRLIALDAEQVPPHPGSLYVRPVLFSTEGSLVPQPSSEFELVVVLCPVGEYIAAPGGLSLTTSSDCVRAVPGGTGAAKCAGNYAAPLLATERAKTQGFDEVVWLDAEERRFIEEAGTMNLFYVRRGRVLTPPISDTILAGITRDSVLELAREAGFEVGEERVSVDPRDWREVDEVLTTGTAAGIANVCRLVHNGQVLFERPQSGPVHHHLSGRLEEVRYGSGAVPSGWRWVVSPDSRAVAGAS